MYFKKTNQVVKIYYSAKRRTKELPPAVTKKILEIANETLEKADMIIKKVGDTVDIGIGVIYEKVRTVGKKILKQISDKMEGKEVKDKIVSYYEPHVRALPKGKVNKPCEFGTKLRIDMTSNKYITNYKLYQGNPSDVTMLDDAVKEHKKIFPTAFQAAGMDRGYYDEERIQRIENEYKISLAIPHKKRTDKPLSKRKQKIYNK